VVGTAAGVVVTTGTFGACNMAGVVSRGAALHL